MYRQYITHIIHLQSNRPASIVLEMDSFWNHLETYFVTTGPVVSLISPEAILWFHTGTATIR